MSLYKIKLTDIGRGEGGLSSECQQSGDPPKPPLKILLSHTCFKGKRGNNFSLISGGQSHGPSHCGQACQLLVIFLQMFYCAYNLLEIIEGEAGVEIWLSVNYLFFISTSRSMKKPTD